MGKRSLLLVDGDARSLRVLEVSLRKAGFIVTTAVNGRDGLEKARTTRPDLILSDTEMPEMDGFALCRELKADPGLARIPFVFLTGQGGIESKIRGLELGVDEYLTKPIYIKEVLTRIRILLQKKERTSLEGRRDPNTRFAGTLHDMGVVDLIQTIEVSRKSGLIHFTAPAARQATVYFRDGSVIDAEAGHLQGADAVYRLLTWSEGEFELLFRNVRRKDAIQVPTPALLMEGMRRLDEWGRLLEQLPPLTTRFEVDVEQLAARLADLPDELNRILRLFDGRRSLLDVIDLVGIGDLECLDLVSRLYFDELLREVEDAPTEPTSEVSADLLLDGWLGRQEATDLLVGPDSPRVEVPITAEPDWAGEATAEWDAAELAAADVVGPAGSAMPAPSPPAVVAAPTAEVDFAGDTEESPTAPFGFAAPGRSAAAPPRAERPGGNGVSVGRVALVRRQASSQGGEPAGSGPRAAAPTPSTAADAGPELVAMRDSDPEEMPGTETAAMSTT
ncbi:MAG TPA: DUF4388 domain-containing protein, partial [Candidatus Acidoferrum sp.]|nr:DUF4388 domain-containing protein [Candidatus Acidoferrum sp.]